MDKTKRIILTCYITLGINGLLSLALGSLIPYFRESLNLEYEFIGLILSSHSIGNMFAAYSFGLVQNKIGSRKAILSYNLAYILSLIIMILTNNKYILLVGIFLTGVSRGSSINFNTKTLVDIDPTSAKYTNILHAMFGLGALSFPLFLLGVVFFSPSNWKLSLIILLVLGILAWILYYKMDIEDNNKENKVNNSYGFLKEPLFYLGSLVLFFYLSTEQGIVGWLITYLTDSGYLSQDISQLMASLLWTMIMIGRLILGNMKNNVNIKGLLVMMSVGTLLFIILLVNSTNSILIMIGITGCGLCMAGIYPITVACIGFLTKKYSLMWSNVLSFGMLGSILTPIIMGNVAKIFGINASMNTIIFTALLDLIIIIMLYYKLNIDNKGN